MVYYRYTTFAERLGPHNAKSIVFHYLGVMIMVYLILTIRNCIQEISDKCPIESEISNLNDKPEEALGEKSPSGFWTGIICNISTSNYTIAVIFRKYLDFTAYYVSLFVAIMNSAVMVILSKHLYKAFFLKIPECTKPKNRNGAQNNNMTDTSVSIDMEMQDCANALVCVDDNFCIEVILAAFDFFRVSETKMD